MTVQGSPLTEQQTKELERDIATELASADGAQISFDGKHLLQFVGLLLVARRIVSIPEFTDAACHGVITIAKDYFQHSPTVLQMIAAGELIGADASLISIDTAKAEIEAIEKKATLIVDAVTTFNLVVAVQMATRVVQVVTLSDVADGFIRLALTHFADCPSVSRVIELGCDPANDIIGGFRPAGMRLQ